MKKIITVSLVAVLLLIGLSTSASAMEVPPYSIDTFEEYQKFIKENDLPKDFVYYESVSMFGPYKYLTFYTMFTPYFDGDADEYQYTFEVEKKEEASFSGGYIDLQIQNEYDDDSKYGRKKSIETDVDDLLYVNESNVYYVFEGAIYTYGKSGDLTAIKWENNGKLYTLAPINFKDNLFPPDSVVGKLLDKGTAPEVIEMLKSYKFCEEAEVTTPIETTDEELTTETIPTETPDIPETSDTPKPPEATDSPTPPDTSDISAIFFTLGVISAGGFTVFAVKKKKYK